MSLAVNAVVAGLAVFVIVAGSIWYLTVDRQRDRIQVTDIQHQWIGHVGESDRIEVRATFENRYNVEAKLLGWRYELQVHNARIAFAESTEGTTIEPNRDHTATIQLDVPTDFVGAWVRGHMTSDESTQSRFQGEALFEVSRRNVTVSFGPRVEWKTDLRSSLEAIENCPKESGPCIADTEARWETQGEATVLRIGFELENPSSDDVVVGARSAELVWGSVAVGRGDSHTAVTVPARGSATIDFSIYLVHGLLTDWWTGHVGRCESSPTSLRLVLNYQAESEPTPTVVPTTSTSPTPTTTTSASPTTTSQSPTTSTSTSPTSSSPSETTDETPTSPTDNDTDGPEPARPMSVFAADILLDPVIALQPAEGEPSTVSWEFAGPVLRTEFVCSPG